MAKFEWMITVDNYDLSRFFDFDEFMDDFIPLGYQWEDLSPQTTALIWKYWKSKEDFAKAQKELRDQIKARLDKDEGRASISSTVKRSVWDIDLEESPMWDKKRP